jgi:ribosome-binding protein aMBF1 (putative translation factor)
MDDIERTEKWREGRGLSCRKMARELEVCASSYIRWRRGDWEWTDPVLDRLSRLTGIPMSVYLRERSVRRIVA